MSFAPYANKSPFKYFTTKIEITTQLTTTNHSSTLSTNHVRFPETQTNWTPDMGKQKTSSSSSEIVEEKYHKLNNTKLNEDPIPITASYSIVAFLTHSGDSKDGSNKASSSNNK